MKIKTNYVVGFIFSADFEQVALIRKNRQDWQKGLLNGVGGHINPGEAEHEAMVREAREEAGIETLPDQWRKYAALDGGDFYVACLAVQLQVLDLTGLVKTMTDEKIEIHRVRDIHPLRRDMIENTPWLIALAIDARTDGRPHIVQAHYQHA